VGRAVRRRVVELAGVGAGADGDARDAMRARRATRAAIIAAVPLTVVAIAGADRVYRACLRERVLNWGTTEAESRAALPGDDLLRDAEIVATRAVTIEAPACAVWPWLVQMGPRRGGAYTHDWMERLFGLDMHSTHCIIPQLQDLRVGDVMPMTPAGSGMRVEVLEPQRTLTTRSEDGRWVWTFALRAVGRRTRLLSRNRIAPRRTFGERLGMSLMESGSLVMERKMLLGIKERAERLAAHEEPGWPPGSARAPHGPAADAGTPRPTLLTPRHRR
jgi:hypothetical protein